MMISCLELSKLLFYIVLIVIIIKKYIFFFHIYLFFYLIFFRTKETLASGNMLSVINVLMQLRKVCNHPNLFEPRPTISPFQMESLNFTVPRVVFNMLEYDPFNVRILKI